MKHWHRCQRWTRRGATCPFRRWEDHEDTEDDQEEDAPEKDPVGIPIPAKRPVRPDKLKAVVEEQVKKIIEETITAPAPHVQGVRGQILAGGPVLDNVPVDEPVPPPSGEPQPAPEPPATVPKPIPPGRPGQLGKPGDPFGLPTAALLAVAAAIGIAVLTRNPGSAVRRIAAIVPVLIPGAAEDALASQILHPGMTRDEDLRLSERTSRVPGHPGGPRREDIPPEPRQESPPKARPLLFNASERMDQMFAGVTGDRPPF